MLNRCLFAAFIAITAFGCTTVVNRPVVQPDPTLEGVTVLCETGTNPGVTAGIWVGKGVGHPQPAIITPGTTAAGVCAIVNKLALDAGFKTSYSSSSATGIEIYGRPSDIIIQCKLIAVQIQQFQPGASGPSPWTNCQQYSIKNEAAKTRASIPGRCPERTPCESIEFVINDNSHVTAKLTLNVLRTKEWAKQLAQNYVDSNLPAELTQEYSWGTGRVKDGRVVLSEVLFTENQPPSLQQVHPVPLAPGHVPGCGALPKSPCYPNSKQVVRVKFPSYSNEIAVQIRDDYQKFLMQYQPFPIPGHWDDKGWISYGHFTLFGGLSFLVDEHLPMSKQHIVATFREDSVIGHMRIPNIVDRQVAFSLKGKTERFSIDLVDPQTAAQYPLDKYSVECVKIESISPVYMIIVAHAGPASTKKSDSRERGAAPSTSQKLCL